MMQWIHTGLSLVLVTWIPFGITRAVMRFSIDVTSENGMM